MYKNGSLQGLYCDHITTLQVTINRNLNSISIKTRIKKKVHRKIEFLNRNANTFLSPHLARAPMAPFNQI